VLHAAGAPEGTDATEPSDYHVEAGDPGVRPLAGTPGQEATA
jgi:hypothetical protein